MPRPATIPTLSATQAKYILEKLIRERVVTGADVRRHLEGLTSEMNALERRIAELRGLAGSVHPVRKTKTAVQRVVKHAAKTPEAAASRKLQGQYIAAVRQLPKTQRKRFAEIAKSNGREEAIAAIKKHLGR
ncbi:MAG TPA: hypothetical protein VLN59_07540 [Burkholderiales bacterium]|nr:hypothetical protein [Burkholderiales bacterium]